MNPKKLNLKARHESGVMVRVSLWNARQDGKRVGKVSLRFLDMEGVPLIAVPPSLLDAWRPWIASIGDSELPGWSRPADPAGWSFL